MGVVRKVIEESVPFVYEDYFPHLDKYFRFTSIPLGEHFITTGFDITDIKKSQKLAEQNQIRLEITNKELESFSYSVSHDLRAPLRAIDGYSQIILRKKGDDFDEHTKHHFNLIRDSVKQMGQLIEDLLALSRAGKEALTTSELDMENLVREAWKQVKSPDPDKPVELRIGHLPPGRGDRSLIKQVFINLLSNAVKFTKGREAPLIEAAGNETGAENVYYVKDNGAGFDMQYYDKIFGVFQRLHSSSDYEGTGVGLAIVQRIIHRHGCRVWAESKVGEGACFYFTLPRSIR